MKSFSFLLVCCLFSTGIFAQYFTPSGVDIYNTNTGSVGIGIVPGNFSGVTFSSPLLTVKGSLNVKGTSGDGVAVISMGGQTYRKASLYTPIADGDSGYLAFAISPAGSSSFGKEYMRLKGSGFLGIGTPQPSAMVHIFSSSRDMLKLSKDGGARADWVFKHTDLSGYGNLSLKNGDDTVNVISFRSDGRVGIGKYAFKPEAVLHIASDSADLFKITRIGSNQARWSFVHADDGGLGHLIIRNDEGATMPLTLRSDGNVGIGTMHPGEKLSVDGNVSTRKLKVTQVGWSDYVFNDDYQLRSLSSVEEYIQLHKHLPEVPSAKEVEAKGIDVGDTQSLLLKKIEELTLYIIDLKKQSVLQGKQLEQQNKRIKRMERKLID